MNKNYWQQRWKCNEIGFNQTQPNLLMQRYFPELNLKKGARVFVPLCGKSIDMIWLASQGVRVVGIELNEQACEAFFKENNIPFKQTEVDNFIIFQADEIVLFAGDFFELNKYTLGQIDAVYDRAALIALPENVRKMYSAHMMSLLEPSAKILLITTSYDQTQMQGPPFSVDEMEVKALFKANFDVRRLYHKTVRVIPEHLKEQGLVEATENVFSLFKNA